MDSLGEFVRHEEEGDEVEQSYEDERALVEVEGVGPAALRDPPAKDILRAT
jgi:hypothetical protein